MKNKTQFIFGFSLVVFAIGLIMASIIIVAVSDKLSILNAKTATISVINTSNQPLSLIDKVGQVTDPAMIWNFFLTKESVPSFINQLKKIGSQVGGEVSVLYFNINRNPSTHWGNLLTLIIKLEGDWRVIKYMHKVIETLPYHSRLTRLSLKQPDLATGVDRWTSEITLNMILK